METEETHNYRVVGSMYKGLCGEYESFTRVNKVIVAHNEREAQFLAFQQGIIPLKSKDLGKVVGQTGSI